MPKCICLFSVAIGLIAGAPRLSAGINLISRLSDARASAQTRYHSSFPPAQQQTDFLAANLSNSADVSGEEGAGHGGSTSNSSIVADYSLGTLRVSGNGTANASAFVDGSQGRGSANLIVLTFELTDFTYTYSVDGQLSGRQCYYVYECADATAKLTTGSSTIFEASAGALNPSPVTLSQAGQLSPGIYTLTVDLSASAFGPIGSGSYVNGDANFNFALDSTGQTPTPTPEPTASPTPTPTPTPPPCGVTLSETFDGVTPSALPAGWTTSGTGSAGHWQTSTTTPASAPIDAFSYPVSGIGDSEMVTPVIAVPAAGAILSFQNLFNLQAEYAPSFVGYDGMVLELSINSGPYSDIIEAGGSFVTGGYTHTIINNADHSSPIGGRMAWSGLSAGSTFAPAYLTTTVNLPPTASGQNIRLKWRLATDRWPNGQMPAPGVRIDSIFITPASCAGSPTPTPAPSPAQALNISTRLRVETGSSIAIGGFIVTGSAPKKVVIRGIGPSLGNFGLSDVLADPTLELRDHAGTTLAQNDNWEDDSIQAAQLASFNLALQHPNESGIVAVLEPGAYTALLAGKNQTSGIGLVEIYDADTNASSQLANISTRGFVRTGDNVMIGGFVLGNSGTRTNVIARGIGPSLSQFGLSYVLADPTLELRDSNGALLATNDNWQDDSASAARLTARGLAPSQPAEAGIFTTLPPGAFTAILTGKNGGTGLGLVEVYNVP